MLRVTENMLYSQMNRGVMTAQRKAYDAQRIAQTGVRVNKPSDDPVAASRANVIKSGISRLDSMENVSKRALQELTAAESGMGHSLDILSRVQELALSASNGTLSDANRQEIGKEVSYLKDELMSVANTRVLGEYIFSGLKTDTITFQSDGTYNGANGRREVEVAPGIKVFTNYPGDQAFGDSNIIGTSSFDVLQNLFDAIATNDTTAISAELDNLEAIEDQFITARGFLGSQMEAINSADTLRTEIAHSMEIRRVETVDADIVEAYSDLARTQNALQAAVQQATKVINGMRNSIV